MSPSGFRPPFARPCSLLFVFATLAVPAVADSGAAVEGNPPFLVSQRVIAGGGESHARSACFDLAATIAEPVAGRPAGGACSSPDSRQARDSIFRSSRLSAMIRFPALLLACCLPMAGAVHAQRNSSPDFTYQGA